MKKSNIILIISLVGVLFLIAFMYFIKYPFVYGKINASEEDYQSGKINASEEYQQISPSKEYYEGLLEKCKKYDSPTELECCRSSVEEMAKRGLKEPLNSTCPSGYIYVIAKCNGAIPFCYKEPESIEIKKVEDCLKLQETDSIFKPVAYSNLPSDPKDYINESTRKVDSCILNYVDKHKEIIDKEICGKIVSPYYYYLCLLRIAFHNNDSSLCNLEFLGKQSNINGCFYVLSVQLKNRSLCYESSQPDVCLSNYDYVYNNGTRPRTTLGSN